MKSNKVFYKVSKPEEGRRFAIGDIHGCSKTLKNLVLEKLKLTKSDQLFLLGDYIDKGPDSKGVLDFILKLKSNKYQVFPIRGNHEQMLLDSAENDKPRVFEKLLRLNKIRNLADESGILYPKYYELLSSLKYYVVLDDFYLVHAGVVLSEKNIFSNLNKIMWLRTEITDLQLAKLKLKGKRIIHGHTPTAIKKIRQQIETRNQIICLDNGCCDVHKKRKTFEEGEIGRLCALDLDRFQLFEVWNIDSEKRIRKSKL